MEKKVCPVCGSLLNENGVCTNMLCDDCKRVISKARDNILDEIRTKQ